MAKHQHTLTNFTAKIRKEGFARPSLFAVEFEKKFEFTVEQLDTVLMFCEQTELPGVNLEILRSDTYPDNTRYIPYNTQYSQQLFSFYVDSNYLVKSFFDRWFLEIIQPEGKSFSFPQRYTTNINIYALNKRGDVVYKVILNDAYPVALNPIDVGYGLSNEIARLPVLFQYTNWSAVRIDDNGNGTGDFPKPEIIKDLGRQIFDRRSTLRKVEGMFQRNIANAAIDRAIKVPAVKNILKSVIARF